MVLISFSDTWKMENQYHRRMKALDGLKDFDHNSYCILHIFLEASHHSKPDDETGEHKWEEIKKEKFFFSEKHSPIHPFLAILFFWKAAKFTMKFLSSTPQPLVHTLSLQIIFISGSVNYVKKLTTVHWCVDLEIPSSPSSAPPLLWKHSGVYWLLRHPVRIQLTHYPKYSLRFNEYSMDIQ